jgi:hypothetical protein
MVFQTRLAGCRAGKPAVRFRPVLSLLRVPVPVEGGVEFAHPLGQPGAIAPGRSVGLWVRRKPSGSLPPPDGIDPELGGVAAVAAPSLVGSRLCRPWGAALPAPV